MNRSRTYFSCRLFNQILISKTNVLLLFKATALGRYQLLRTFITTICIFLASPKNILQQDKSDIQTIKRKSALPKKKMFIKQSNFYSLLSLSLSHPFLFLSFCVIFFWDLRLMLCVLCCASYGAIFHLKELWKSKKNFPLLFFVSVTYYLFSK